MEGTYRILDNKILLQKEKDVGRAMSNNLILVDLYNERVGVADGSVRAIQLDKQIRQLEVDNNYFMNREYLKSDGTTIKNFGALERIQQKQFLIQAKSGALRNGYYKYLEDNDNEVLESIKTTKGMSDEELAELFNLKTYNGRPDRIAINNFKETLDVKKLSFQQDGTLNNSIRGDNVDVLTALDKKIEKSIEDNTKTGILQNITGVNERDLAFSFYSTLNEIRGSYRQAEIEGNAALQAALQLKLTDYIKALKKNSRNYLGQTRTSEDDILKFGDFFGILGVGRLFADDRRYSELTEILLAPDPSEIDLTNKTADEKMKIINDMNRADSRVQGGLIMRNRLQKLANRSTLNK